MKLIGNVAGITFRNQAEIFTKLQPSGMATLKHDPTNEYDPNAIEIWYDNVMLGFVKSGSWAQEYFKEHPDVRSVNITGYSYATGSGKDLAFNNNHEGRLASVKYEFSDNDGDVIMTEDNRYVINGVEYDRLSTVADHFEPDPDNPGLDMWKIEHDSYNDYRDHLRQTALDGTAMHKAIELFLRDGTDSPLLPAGIHNFIKKYKVEAIGTEKLFVDTVNRIAGTTDLLCTVTDSGNGKTHKHGTFDVIVDWKSSKKPTKKHAIKTSWYGRQAGAEEAWVVTFGGDQKCGYGLMRIPHNKMNCLAEIISLTKRSMDLLYD